MLSLEGARDATLRPSFSDDRPEEEEEFCCESAGWVVHQAPPHTAATFCVQEDEDEEGTGSRPVNNRQTLRNNRMTLGLREPNCDTVTQSHFFCVRKLKHLPIPCDSLKTLGAYSMLRTRTTRLC